MSLTTDGDTGMDAPTSLSLQVPMSEENKDLQIHIHEHVGPLRERVSKLEGRIETHDRELGLLRAGLDSLRDRIDGVRTVLLDALDKHADREEAALDIHMQDAARLSSSYEALSAKVDGLRAWIIALGVGAGGIILMLQLLSHLGAFK